MIRHVLGALAVAGTVLASATSALAQPPVLNAATVSGVTTPFTVTFSWSATAGATSYRLDYGFAPGTTAGNLPLGNVTGTVVPGVPAGTYVVRVVALPGGETSNEIVVQAPAPPGAPTNLQVARNGTAIVAVWNPGAGGSPSSYSLRVGLTPTGNDYVIPVGTTSFATPAPPGTYYFRVVAANAAGVSGESNTVALTMPSGGACDPAPAPTLTNTTFSGLLRFTWTAIPGVVGYIADASVNGVLTYPNVPFPASQTSYANILPLATYGISMRGQFSCGSQGTPGTITIVHNGAPPPGPRTPDPAPGQRLPQPSYGQSVVNAVAAERPDLLRNSCVDTGGNNRFMFEVTRRLRAIDNRWGNNIKRCGQGLSQDIVTYNNSSLPDEGATTTAQGINVYMYDIIGGHCGPSPSPNWASVHDVTAQTSCGMWTLQYYINAGYQP